MGLVVDYVDVNASGRRRGTRVRVIGATCGCVLCWIGNDRRAVRGRVSAGGEDLRNHRGVDDRGDDLEAAKRCGGAFDDLGKH